MASRQQEEKERLVQFIRIFSEACEGSDRELGAFALLCSRLCDTVHSRTVAHGEYNDISTAYIALEEQKMNERLEKHRLKMAGIKASQSQSKRQRRQ